MQNEQLYYFEKSRIFKALMHFSLPMMISSLLSVIYGILNLYFISFLLTGMLQATGQGRGSTIMVLAQGLIIIPVLFVLGQLFRINWCRLVMTRGRNALFTT